MVRITKARPTFPATDVAKAAEWYRDKLGFKIASLHPEHGHAIVYRDDIEVHLWRCRNREVAQNTSAYFRLDDIEALHGSMLKAREGGRIGEVEDRPWSMREFYAWDPDGNLLKFGAPARAVAAE